MYLLQVKQISIFQRVLRVWDARVDRWKKDGEVEPKPKKHKVTQDILLRGLSHPDTIAELNGTQSTVRNHSTQ